MNWDHSRLDKARLPPTPPTHTHTTITITTFMLRLKLETVVYFHCWIQSLLIPRIPVWSSSEQWCWNGTNRKLLESLMTSPKANWCSIPIIPHNNNTLSTISFSLSLSYWLWHILTQQRAVHFIVNGFQRYFKLFHQGTVTENNNVIFGLFSSVAEYFTMLLNNKKWLCCVNISQVLNIGLFSDKVLFDASDAKWRSSWKQALRFGTTMQQQQQSTSNST